jgi:hypothetical protein
LNEKEPEAAVVGGLKLPPQPRQVFLFHRHHPSEWATFVADVILFIEGVDVDGELAPELPRVQPS